MDRDALVRALRRTDSASQACAAALTAGADFEVCETVTNTSELIQIYRRRAKRLDATGLGHGGVDQALADLEAWGAGVVRLGQVRASAEQRQFQLFLAAGADEVVACLWAHHDP